MYPNQSVFQITSYEKLQKTRQTEVTLLCCILYYVAFMKSVHYHTEIACSEPIYHAYILSLFVG